MKIAELVFNYLDLIFALVSSILYFSFFFLAKELIAKFLIFFTSIFVNIFAYSVFLKNEYNFFTFILLNSVFIIIIVFYYLLSDFNEDHLPTEFNTRTNIKYVVILSFFIFGFIFTTSLFSLFFRQDDLKNFNYKTKIIESEKIIKKNNKNITNIDITTSNSGRKNIFYTKKINIKSFDFFKNYNLIILLYIIFVNLTFFSLKEDN